MVSYACKSAVKWEVIYYWYKHKVVILWKVIMYKSYYRMQVFSFRNLL